MSELSRSDSAGVFLECVGKIVDVCESEFLRNILDPLFAVALCGQAAHDAAEPDDAVVDLSGLDFRWTDVNGM